MWRGVARALQWRGGWRGARRGARGVSRREDARGCIAVVVGGVGESGERCRLHEAGGLTCLVAIEFDECAWVCSTSQAGLRWWPPRSDIVKLKVFIADGTSVRRHDIGPWRTAPILHGRPYVAAHIRTALATTGLYTPSATSRRTSG